MPETDLLTVCGVAGLAVLAVLSFLAGVIHVLNRLCPAPVEPAGTTEAVVVAAIAGAVQAAWPGARVTGIEEQK